ncbi:MAG: magnesium chelatase [Chloroflexi bacterium RBG_16_56_11]|nr:MAG: magnesium chelatase [Chloroflexi bacterium RBG_16_56_11]
MGELRATGYRQVPVREEMRRNLISMIKGKKAIFPGIIGYDDTVIPAVENAILSGQDIIFLGERGQAKSRIMRLLVNLLDAEIPAIKGCEINDDPFSPICKSCREKVGRDGEATEITWLPREERYGEKLATPDTTIADLIGDVDPIKVAEGRYLSDELTIHYGIIPRTNRGIFCINELPDLMERLQVGLFNLMEEADIQIKGYRIRLPLDIFIVASANPEDYTSRGRIITPLKDRFGSQIRTHYPASTEDEIAIVEQEWQQFKADELDYYVPEYMKEIIAEITHLARKSADIGQRSGVSVRVSIANQETVVSNAIRRAIRLGEKLAVPRISDLPFIVASTTGKVELESFEDTNEEKIIDDLTRKAVLSVFNRYYKFDELEEIVGQFNKGFSVETSDMMSAKSYLRNAKEMIGLAKAVKKMNDSDKPEIVASITEFILEGLHLNKRLNKSRVDGKTLYRK